VGRVLEECILTPRRSAGLLTGKFTGNPYRRADLEIGAPMSLHSGAVAGCARAAAQSGILLCRGLAIRQPSEIPSAPPMAAHAECHSAIQQSSTLRYRDSPFAARQE